MNDFTNVGQMLNDMELERDNAIALAERAEGDLRELRENVLIGLGMTAEDVAEMDGDLMEPSISFLLRGCQEAFYELAALRAQLAAGEWLSPDTAIESGPVQIILNAQAVDFFFYSPDESGRMIFKDSIVAWRPAPSQE